MQTSAYLSEFGNIDIYRFLKLQAMRSRLMELQNKVNGSKADMSDDEDSCKAPASEGEGRSAEEDDGRFAGPSCSYRNTN